VTDGDAGNVSNGVERTGSAVKRNAKIASARLACGFVLRQCRQGKNEKKTQKDK
jgi:hypothetical protein